MIPISGKFHASILMNPLSETPQQAPKHGTALAQSHFDQPYTRHTSRDNLMSEDRKQMIEKSRKLKTRRCKMAMSSSPEGRGDERKTHQSWRDNNVDLFFDTERLLDIVFFRKFYGRGKETI